MREREREERERERERDLQSAVITERPIYAQKTAANFLVTCCILHKMGMIIVGKMKCSIRMYFSCHNLPF